MAKRFILRLRLSTEHHYPFKPSPCLKRVELTLNEQIFNTIDITAELTIVTISLPIVSSIISLPYSHNSQPQPALKYDLAAYFDL